MGKSIRNEGELGLMEQLTFDWYVKNKKIEEEPKPVPVYSEPKKIILRKKPKK